MTTVMGNIGNDFYSAFCKPDAARRGASAIGVQLAVTINGAAIAVIFALPVLFVQRLRRA